MRFLPHNSRVEKSNIDIFKAIKLLTWVFPSLLKCLSLSKVLTFSSLRARFVFLFLLLPITIGLLTYAQTSDDQYDINVVNVFPGSIKASSGWKNVETLSQQNLDSYSLYQEFNTINSASLELEVVSLEQILKNRKAEDVNLPDDSKTVDSESENTTIEIPVNNEKVGGDQVVATGTDTITSSNLLETITEPEPDHNTQSENNDSSRSENLDDVIYDPASPLPIETEVETTSPTVFKRVTDALSLVVESVTDLLPTDNEEVGTLNIEEVKEVNNNLSFENESLSQTIAPTYTDEVFVVDQKTEISPEDLSDSEKTSSTTEDASKTDDRILSTLEPDLEEKSESTTDLSESILVDDCNDECADYRITLSDFGLPIFDDGLILDGVQLKLSLAAKMKTTREESQWLTSRYSLDGGASWTTGGEILISEEISNSTNGGYFVLPLPKIDDGQILDQLMVELIYQNDPRALEGLFIDSVWLELFTITPPLPTETSALLTDDGYDNKMLKGDTLQLPDGEAIDFTFTDDNTDETLIIKSDKVSYPGLSETTLYFNITNTSNSSDTFNLQTYFPEGIGKVNSISEWNQNKPKDVIVPEYKPFVYHCEAGWELTNNPVNSNLEDISKLLTPSDTKDIIESETENSTTSTEDNVSNEESSVSPVEENTDTTSVEVNTTTDSTTTFEKTDAIESSTEEFTPVTDKIDGPLKPVDTEAPLLQSIIENKISSTTETVISDDELVTSYVCRNTNIVRECDEIDGDNTACRVNDVKVREHQLVQYVDDWEIESVTEGKSEDTRSFFKKAKDFLGFGPNIKAVPDTFEVRAHTPNQYTIAAGETKYFKMKISFPPLTNGEFWIEAVGDDEYGLLDPYWSSQWQYRMPVTIDNTTSSQSLTEYQVFLELNSSLTDFWTNVNDDGSDIRFVQETITGTEDAWYGTGWSDRIPITIQSSQVDETMVDFPVYVNLADLGSSFFNKVQSDGDDIRVTESDGLTERPIDLVSINTGSDTGELHFSGDVSSTTDTTFYIYFGNSDAAGYADTDTYGAENVWGIEFAAVYHLEEAASGRGTSGLYQDSTSNAYDGDDQLNSIGKSGKLGQGQEVNAQGDASEYLLLPSGIVNGQTELTFSYWINSSDAGNQALISGGANNEYLFYLTGGGTNFDLFPGGAVTVPDLTNSTWRHIVVTRDTVANLWRVYVDGQFIGQDSTTLSTLSIPANCLVIGLEQDTSCLSSGDTSQHLNANIDEMRFWNNNPTAGEINATYRNQSTSTDFYATSTIESFISTSFSELDFWVQHFSTSTDEADIWVQVDSLPANASTTIYLYYGNTNAVSASDEKDTFTYSTTTELYYVVDGNSTGDIEVYSLINNNEVSIDGGTPITLDEGETTAFSTYSSSSVISALGPISATINSAQADSISPIGFATTTHAVPTNRNTSQYFIHSPFGEATVNTYIGNSGTPDQSLTIATGTTALSNTDAAGNNGVIIESDLPILVYHQELTRDSIVVYPPTTRDIFGIDSNNTYITSLTDNPDPTVYCSGGNTAAVNGVIRGEAQAMNTCTQGNNGVGDSVRYTGATYPITSIQQADVDGSESTAFWPQHEFSTQYYMTTGSAYAAIACSPRFGTSTIEVQTNGGTTVQSADCVPSGNLPGKAYFDNGQGGSALAFTAGHQIVSTNGVPFYVIYEDDEEDNDETNIMGAVQARKYVGYEPTYTFGAQDIVIDAQYEQLSFGWYENTNNQTPTSTWPLGEGSYATEGVSITGGGAINIGDVLRLRMNLRANVATGSASSTAFKLQYSEATAGQCSAVSVWYDVGDIGSTTTAFAGYNNSQVVDGSTLASTTLSSSTVFGTYEEENLSEFIPNTIGLNEVAEWDWTITNVAATTNANYCFRQIRSTGLPLATYTEYPEVETAGPPLQPTLLTYFDNERTAGYNPVVLDFTATDIADDDIRYQIEIDDAVDFSSPTVSSDSQINLAQFENVNTPSDKTPFDSSAQIRFTGTGSLTASTTYWWRVRGNDPDGSNTWGEWSTPYSFTTDGSVTVSEWHQTTGDQFSTNSLTSLSTSTGAVAVSGSSGVMISTPIDFDDATVGNAWGEFSWNDTETSGTILYQIEYLNGSAWTLIPDTVISNNSTGNGTSPINLLDLDTDTYNQIRLVANFTGTSLSLEDWTILWGQRVETPILSDPFDNEKIATTTPTLDFSTTDPQGDLLEYEISWGTDNTFVSSSTRNSSTSPGFLAGNPYASGANVTYTLQSGETLTDGVTYWWRVRAKDPYGGDAWSPWSDPDSFTVDTTVSVSTWFQTTDEQLQTGELIGLSASSTGDLVTNDAQIGEYGTVVVTNGSSTEVTMGRSYNNPVVVASVRYDRSGADGTQRYARVQSKGTDTFTLYVSNYNNTVTGTTTVDYMVVEAGDWTLDDGGSGTRIVAGTVNVSTISGRSVPTNPGGTVVSFSPAFSGSAPAVITTVSSNNDLDWVLSSTYDGSNTIKGPGVSGFTSFLNMNWVTPISHGAEDVDYVSVAQGNGTVAGSEFQSIVTADTIGVAAEAVTFSPAFSSTPQVTLTHQGSQDGGDGGYGMVDTANPTTVNEVYVALDEDGPSNSRNGHSNEIFSVIAFANSSGDLLSQAGDGLTGTLTGPAIPFSDGAGPKFEQALFNANSTGGSTTTVQVQYQTATGSWALIPDSVIAGNSSGATSSPIDLTGVDVGVYDTIRLVATLICSDTTCPTLNDWAVEWSEGVLISGTIKEYDRFTNVTSGTVSVAVNGTPGNTGSIAGDGTWSINNVTAFDGDTITVWVDGAAESDEAVAVFIYDGAGDMTGVQLFEQHLSLSADENGTTTNALLGVYDNSVSGDEDIFFEVDVNNDLAVCTTTGCSEANLYVGNGDIYIPDTTGSGNISTHDLINDGRIEFDGNTVRVSGSWDNNNQLSIDTSSVIFTATSTNETIDDNDSLLDFYNLTFGETSGTATWKTFDPVDTNGYLTITYGTLDRASSTLTIAGNLSIAANGFFTGLSTTTFDGSTAALWSDANTTKQDVGYAVVDGSAKTVTLQSSVRSETITIGVNDTLNAGGTNTLSIAGNFTNNNIFSAQTGTLEIIGADTTAIITTNGSSLYNFIASTTGSGNVAFTETNQTLLGSFTIATGTVTLPTGTLSVGGSFTNTGGVFAHNNATVRLTGTGSQTILSNGSAFLNNFYNLSFTGSGNYSFLDTNATTTNNLTISAGNVSFPTGILTIGRNLTVSGSGAFTHNGGEVIFLIEGNDTITSNNSAFNDIRIREGSGGSSTWYDVNWLYRIPITVKASALSEDLTDFPVYVDLADLPSSFFSNITSDGGDIRVTESDGQTEVAREIVFASTTALTGEMYFNSSSTSSTTDTIFYIYYGNSLASDYAVTDTYGAENVWSNGYVLVSHLNDETTSTVVNSANGSLDGTKDAANSPSVTTSGKIYDAQDHEGLGHIGYGNVGSNATNITISAWINPSNLTGSGETSTYGYSIFSAHSAGNYTWLTVGGTGGGGSVDEVRFCAFSSSATCNVASGSNVGTGQWHYVSATAVDGGAAAVRVDGNNVLSFTSNGGGTWNSGSTIADLRPDRNIEFEGIIDEVQISNVVRSTGWQDATYLNQGTTSDFYTVGSPQQDNVRTFASTNVTALGDVVIESGTAVFPTGNFAIGGSFTNNNQFDSNGGTVVFNSTSSSETIASGISTFYDLTFDDLGGEWTIIENATATNDIQLLSANTLVIDTGVTLESTGTFTNDLANASTTWAGATLKLSGGTDFAINAKTNLGDDYNILSVTGDGDINMWNSSAATYDTQNTSSIYSQDHDGVDGDLNIYGDYVRDSGIEYWSYATDFDGADLVASSSERQVDVRIESGASVLASSSELQIVGADSASTTVDSISGTFALTANHTTVTAQYFTMTGTDATGFALTASSTITSFDDALFTIGAVSSAINVDASTIDTNPAAQFFNTDFVTNGGNVNVTLSGSPSSYWWFRDGVGDRYGEAFDNGDGNPGSIRFDDSSYSIVISGTVYADDGTTSLGGPTCDGVTENVRIVVDGGTYSSSTPCSGIDGTYSFGGVNYIGDPNIIVYLDTNGGVNGSVITKTPSTDITDFDIYANRVMTRHEDTAPLTIADMAVYDEADDTDIRFVAATGTTNTLVVRPETELYIFATTTFTPGGTITLESGGSGATYDGTLHLGDGATLVAASGVATTTHQIGGSLMLEPSAIFTTASSTFAFTATTTGKTITASTSLTFNKLRFTGVGGGWNLNTGITAFDDIEVATGTVTGTEDVTVLYGSFYGDGLVSLGSGTTLIERSSTLGGLQGWTFSNLTLGNGSVVGTTTPGGTATNTVSGVLTISNAHFLEAGNSAWSLTGSGSVFVETGTFLEDTSTIAYSGVAGSNVLSTTYYNLTINASGGTPTYTAGATGILIENNLLVGGVASTIFTLNTNDPVVTANGDIYLASNGTLVGSNSSTLTINGSWDNDGTFASSNGLVDFASADVFTIAAGNSDFGDVLISGAGPASITEHATSTGAWTLATTSDFTVNSGQNLAVGGLFSNNAAGSATTWTGSTLHLFGAGQYEINASTTADTYDTLSAAAGTHIRMWNSSSSVYATASGGSIYSMDHSNVSGDLYIFGDYIKSSGTDYWSYATDFDGTDLTSTERPVSVLIESSGSVTYSGGTLAMIGSTTATTTISTQGGGDYSFDITAGTFNAQYYEFNDLDSDGVTMTGSPTITSLSNGAWVLDTDADIALTVNGTVIDQNPGKNILNNIFATTTGVATAINVRTVGSTVSSWRYNIHAGDIDGEDFDDDNGDPGYIVWDNSTTTYTIGGTVYQNDTVTPSGVCGGTANIVLAVNNVTVASTTCNGSGVYQFADTNFDSNDVLTVYINDETQNAVTVTKEPISSINNLDLYEDHVIVRHENVNPLNIIDMIQWDSSDDPTDIIFTATDASPDTLSLAADTKLIIWNGKEFEPQGNITTGAGSGDAIDGTVELFVNSTLTLGNAESHSFGGNLEMGTGSIFTPAQSTVTLTSDGSGRTIDTNDNGFYNLVLNGAGTFSSLDNAFNIANDLSLTLGGLTLPSATTTISGSLSVTGGSFNSNNGLVEFDGSGTETIVVNGSDFNELLFTGSGSWSINDTNATTTNDVNIANGSVTLPSGIFAVGGSFINEGGNFTHNTSNLVMATSGSATLLASSSDLYAVTFDGGGTFTMTDNSLALLDDLTIVSGNLTLASGTLSIGGSFSAIGGTFDHASGTILFNSSDTGETINPGMSDFNNVSIASAGGGWSVTADATTTGNFLLTSANSFTLNSGVNLAVEGVFGNSVGGGATTWANSNLKLLSGTDYSINTKSAGGDVYGTLYLAENMDLRMWNSSAATTTLASSSVSSLYSQDHSATDGYLYIYGNYQIATGTEYWSYANDFDGTTGVNRQAHVFLVDNASSSITQTAGNLNIVGAIGATTSIQAIGSTAYSLIVSGGTFNASYYELRDLDINGLNFSGTPTISSLSNGDFEVAIDNGSAITLTSTALNANPSKLIDDVRFATTTAISAVNVNLNATTTNAWTFRAHIGNLSGEDYDVDGVDNCGSIRWDDSACLLVEQTHYRWRYDDGGEGVPNSEWFDSSWNARQRVRIKNNDNMFYATTTVKVNVTYDADMQADFDDLRFTTSDGVTELDFWLERYTASTDATVWVEIFNLPASDNLDLFMYYNNGSAASVSSSTATFVAIDDFEDNNISEYSGDTSKFQTDATFAFGGSYGLEPVTASDFTNDGIARFDQTISQGQIIRYMQYVDTGAGSGDEACTMFGIQSPVANNQNYAVCLEQFLTDRMSLVRNVERSDNYRSVVMLASTTVSYSTGWYEVEIDWQTDDSIFVTLYNSGGSVVATTTATDSNYTSGGIGFTYWGQNGGWDSYTARYRTDTKPTVLFGAEQTDGGANWAAALDSAGDVFEIGDTSRLRLSVENSGLDITGQQFQLEFAAKDSAPTCEAVSASSYVSVPEQASCGSSPLCMVTSSNFVDNDNTTDLLLETNGTFTSGKMVEDPSSLTNALDINQNYYTELEYALTTTINATSSAYCLRVTDDGAELDSYLSVAELGVAFNPSITAWSLNAGADIALSPGTTTTIYATGTVTDLNGFTDFAGATSTAFRSGVTETCSEDQNNCYREETPQCNYTACAGNSCTLSCAFDIYYFAEATDNAPYAGETWRSYVEVADQSGATTSAFAPSVDLLTINAITLATSTNSINYGSLTPAADTGSYNATTTVINIGNNNIDVSIDGTDLSDGGASTIPVSEQKFASTTFDYSACGFCSTLATTSTAIEVNLFKPTSTSTPVVADVYWGIQIPFGTTAAPHQGTNTFYAVTD